MKAQNQRTSDSQSQIRGLSESGTGAMDVPDLLSTIVLGRDQSNYKSVIDCCGAPNGIVGAPFLNRSSLHLVEVTELSLSITVINHSVVMYFSQFTIARPATEIRDESLGP